MSTFVASSGSRAELKAVKVEPAPPFQEGLQLVLELSDGSIVILDYNDAVRVGEGVTELREKQAYVKQLRELREAGVAD